MEGLSKLLSSAVDVGFCVGFLDVLWEDQGLLEQVLFFLKKKKKVKKIVMLCS
jgi:hypothetical protein